MGNYDEGGGGCEPCVDGPQGTMSGCDHRGLPHAGAADCHKWCVGGQQESSSDGASSDGASDECDPNVRKLEFQHLDTDGSGTVEISEIEDFLVSEGQPKEDAAMYMEWFDENANGKVDNKEFNAALVCMIGCNPPSTSSVWTNDNVECPATPASDGDKIKEVFHKLTAKLTAKSKRSPASGGDDNGDGASDECDPNLRKLEFQHLDTDGSGTVEISEIEDFLVSEGQAKEDAAMYMEWFDESGNGKVDNKEFNAALVCMNGCHGGGGQQESDPLAGVDRSDEAEVASSDPSTWTNIDVDCSATKVTSGDADKTKEVMKKLTRKSSGCHVEDPCDANEREGQFHCMDKDGSGTVDKSEVEAMLEEEGAPKEIADMVMDIFDVNGDGTLSGKEVNDVTVCLMGGCASK